MEKKGVIIGALVVLVIISAIFLVNDDVITEKGIDDNLITGEQTGSYEEETTPEPSGDILCREDDFGDYLTKGVVEYNAKEYLDKCIDGRVLLETSCEDGVISKNKVNCNEFFEGNGRCLEGACVFKDKGSYKYCHDGDNWDNDLNIEVDKFIQGDVYISRRTERSYSSREIISYYQDYCRDGRRLIERSCGKDNRIKSKVIKCENGCDSERRICTPDIGAEIKLFNLRGEEGYMVVRVGEPILISEDSYIENIGTKRLEGKIVAKIVVYWFEVKGEEQKREFDIAKSDIILEPGQKVTAEGWSEIAPTVPEDLTRVLDERGIKWLGGYLEVSLVGENGNVIFGDSYQQIRGTMYLDLLI